MHGGSEGAVLGSGPEFGLDNISFTRRRIGKCSMLHSSMCVCVCLCVSIGIISFNVVILRPQVIHKLMVSQPDMIFIDVRTPSEFSKGHVSYSLWLSRIWLGWGVAVRSGLVTQYTYHAVCLLTISQCIIFKND